MSKSETKNVTDTLTTKIMMGTFGCVPAFDTNFCKFLGQPRKVDETALTEVLDIYNVKEIKEIIDDYKKNVYRYDKEGNKTKYEYKKAKIIDLIGFQLGEEEIKKEREEKEKIKKLSKN